MSFSVYLDSMVKEPLLTKEEEFSIGKKIFSLSNKIKKTQALINGLGKSKVDKKNFKLYSEQLNTYEAKHNKYRNQMIQKNLRLVFSIAKKYKTKVIDIMDLVEEGNIGLIKAVDKFDYRKGYRFSTFATWWIRKMIIEYIKEKNRVIRLPSYVQNKLINIKKEIAYYQNTNRTMPMVNELSEITGFKSKDIAFILNTSKDVLSLDLLEEKSNDGADAFRDREGIYNPENDALKNSFKKLLDKVLDSLSDVERKILVMYFGLEQDQPVLLSEIGDALGVTRERVRQVKNQAIDKIKNSEYCNELKYFMAYN